MDKLDHLVTSHLVDRLLAPDRLEQLLAAVAARRAERSAAVDERIAGLQARADEADERLRRLYKMVEDGVAEMDDLLKDRIAALKADRETAHAALGPRPRHEPDADRDSRRQDRGVRPADARAAD